MRKRKDEIRMENEIRKLQILAETGGVFEGSPELPPEVENFFLQHVREIEAERRLAPQVKLHDYIGQPEYKPQEELDDAMLASELDRLISLARGFNKRKKRRRLGSKTFIQHDHG